MCFQALVGCSMIGSRVWTLSNLVNTANFVFNKPKPPMSVILIWCLRVWRAGGFWNQRAIWNVVQHSVTGRSAQKAGKPWPRVKDRQEEYNDGPLQQQEDEDGCCWARGTKASKASKSAATFPSLPHSCSPAAACLQPSRACLQPLLPAAVPWGPWCAASPAALRLSSRRSATEWRDVDWWAGRASVRKIAGFFQETFNKFVFVLYWLVSWTGL